MTLSLKGLCLACGITWLCHYAEHHYAHCSILFIVMLNVIMLSGIMLIAVMLSVVVGTMATCAQGPLVILKIL